MTADATRRRAIGQILLLAAGFLVLVAISASSVMLVNQAREDNGWVVHTVEVENQINTLLLEIRRAESAARGYLLTSEPRFLAEHEDRRRDHPSRRRQAGAADRRQSGSGRQHASSCAPPVEARLGEFAKAIDFVKQQRHRRRHRDAARGRRQQFRRSASTTSPDAMRAEEDRLFALRTATADRTQQLASIVTVAGSGLVIALAGISIFLVRRSARARDEAEAQLRDNNLNLEATVDERTADLREANDEIQRFAYIVSHDLRSPLVNIMGFTSELEELRGDIFRRIAALARAATPRAAGAGRRRRRPSRALEGADKQLSQDFTEALGFIKSSIAKMDRLITAILNLTREGRREFEPVQIDTRELIEGHRHDGGASGRRGRGPDPRSSRCRTSSATGWRWSRFSPT